MPTNSLPKSHRVVFVSPGGVQEFRLMANDTNTICDLANSLKATHFVAVEGHDKLNDLPLWGVFEMRHASKFLGNEWTIRDPVRMFAEREPDAATMYALHISGRR